MQPQFLANEEMTFPIEVEACNPHFAAVLENTVQAHVSESCKASKTDQSILGLKEKVHRRLLTSK